MRPECRLTFVARHRNGDVSIGGKFSSGTKTKINKQTENHQTLVKEYRNV